MKNTDALLKEAQGVDFQRTSDLFDLWRGGMIDREGLNTGCEEIIANAKFQASKNVVQDPEPEKAETEIPKKGMVSTILMALYNTDDAFNPECARFKRLMTWKREFLVPEYNKALKVLEDKAAKKHAESMATPRDQKSMAKQFITKPGDIFTIHSSRGCLSDSISVEVSNPESKENFWLGFKNEFRSWETLKKINGIQARRVMYQIDKDDPIRFEDSIPYKHRFNN